MKTGTTPLCSHLIRALRDIPRDDLNEIREIGVVTIQWSPANMQHTLGWDTLEVRRRLSAATIMYKAVDNQTHLTFPTSVVPAHRSNRSNHPYKFWPTFASTNAYKFSFFPLVIPLCNDLPNSAVNAESVTALQMYALPIIRQYFNAMLTFICCK